MTIEGPAQRLRVCLPLAAGVEVTLGANAAELELASGRRLRVVLPRLAGGGAWGVERQPWFPRFGSVVERACLVAEATGLEDGRWRIEGA